MTPTSHEDRLARQIDSMRMLAHELDLPSTAHYLSIAASKLRDERAEKIARGSASRKASK